MSSSEPDQTPPVTCALGFSLRKRPIVRRFAGGGKIRFVQKPDQITDNSLVAVWASGPFGCSVSDEQMQVMAGQHQQKFSRIYLEDGFLRSVGLGADLVRPLSWVMDRQGIYYDASRPSELETMLQTQVFDDSLLQRAAAFRQRLVSSGLTKYNVGNRHWQRPAAAAGKQLVLVAGQVETDAAIRLGAPGIKTNMALLQAARQLHPDAWLIYKPHPDVVAGLRNAGNQENQAVQWCDQIITDVSINVLLDAVDTVHVLSSLAGFEALIRHKKVVCHGLPFYSGWGLTQDMLVNTRRSRKRDINELVAATLLLYPRYVSRVTGKPCEAEQAFDELLSWRDSVSGSTPLWRKLLRPLLRNP